MQRVRFSYRRGETLKFLSHLDVLRTLHRAFRRAKYPLLYRGKFNPQPRLDPGIPLPLGVTSEREYGEVYLSSLEMDHFIDGINRQLPNPLQLLQTASVSLQEPALMEQINSALYRVFLPNDGESGEIAEEVLNDVLQKLKHSSEIIVFRKGKKKKKKKNRGAPSPRRINISPYLYMLQQIPLPTGKIIEMLLQTGNRGGASPLEVLQKMDEQMEEDLIPQVVGIHRVGLYGFDGKNMTLPPPFTDGNVGSFVR